MDTALLASLDGEGKKKLERAIATLQGDVNAASGVLYVDPKLRLEYSRRIKAMAKASRGIISWEKAAEEANQTRNLLMELIRYRSTPVGKALAQKMKAQGKTLNELIAYKTKALYGDKVNFNNLSVSQKNAVYSAVVQSAGKSNHEVNIKMQRLSGAGRGLIFLSLAVAVYQIYEAEDRVLETQRQLAISSAGIAGAWGGGALAGLMCGPGAPVCVVIGAFVGGAIAAWEISGFWD
ncbi:hypothetical protein EQG67_04315 [Kosakonia cowanii]|uniref:hypothetical protein n=1 Tax=Kosakonia cowanii TaxID=208223 RepID=UPI000FECB5D0|nr:hypothetical protein [Kosakonia cowanii]QAR45037.1 hypothetical protein EQG67_04315 [Kosakonia cowanii]